MSGLSSIEWTEVTWNPTTGCDRVSPGCDHCYALTLAGRLKAMGQAKYQADGDARTSGPGFGIQVHPGTLEEPFRWRKPRQVFVNSMSDLFHPKVPNGFIAAVWATMLATPQHTYQVLTKRPARMSALLGDQDWWSQVVVAAGGLGLRLPDIEGGRGSPLPNVWLGTSVEDQQRAKERIPRLLRTPAAMRFLSCEPLLGPIDFAIDRAWGDPSNPASAPTIDWVIVGGESGRGARPMQLEWARGLRDQCLATGVAFFFKQWGGRTAKSGGRMLDGRTWDEMPRTPETAAPG